MNNEFLTINYDVVGNQAQQDVPGQGSDDFWTRVDPGRRRINRMPDSPISGKRAVAESRNQPGQYLKLFSMC
jgi:hypothetical protein